MGTFLSGAMSESTFARQWRADQTAWQKVRTFEEALPLMADAVEGRRVWNPSIAGEPEEIWREGRDGDTALNPDTLAVGKIMGRIIREGRILTIDSQGGTQKTFPHYKTGKMYVSTQRAYLNFIIKTTRANRVWRALTDAGLLVYPQGYRAPNKSAAYPLTWDRLLTGKKESVTTAVYGVETSAEWANTPFISDPLYNDLVQSTTALMVVDPEPNTNRMWAMIHSALTKNR